MERGFEVVKTIKNNDMTIEKIKKEMLNYRDFYGGDLLDVNEVENAETKKELAEIIERHRSHMEAMLSDANSHLDHLKERLRLTIIQRR